MSMISRIIAAHHVVLTSGPWLTGWSYRVTVTPSATYAGYGLTDFPLYVDLSDMPSGFWDHVKNGGGDIRVCKTGTTDEVPREVVSCDTGTDTGELHFLDDGTASAFDIYYGNAGASDYATDATYGAENVWGDFAFVCHNGGGLDIVSGNTGSANGGVTVGGVVSPIGSATLFDGIDDYVLFDPSPTLANGDASYVSMWLRPDSSQPNYSAVLDQEIRPVVWQDDDSSDQFSMAISSEKTAHVFTSGGNTGSNASGEVLMDDDDHLIHLLFDQANNTLEIYVDGVLDYSDYSYTDDSAIGASGGFSIGADAVGVAGYEYKGRIGEVRIRKTTLSDDWVSAEYANQNSPSTFWTIGSEESQ